MEQLLSLLRTLRGPQGCPWDRQQDHLSLRPYLLEEAAEAVDALSLGQTPAIIEELGDVLLQIAFHSVIGEEEGQFSYPDVEQAIVRKLIARHPHVFGEVHVTSAQEVAARWEALKKQERGSRSPCASVPQSLPALMRAQALQEALGVPAASSEDLLQALQGGDLKELLWQVVAFIRSQGQDPELLLRERCQQACP
jgi:XTP/dITP diphosphohydrolase